MISACTNNSSRCACGGGAGALPPTHLKLGEDEDVRVAQVGEAGHGVQPVLQVAAQHHDDLRTRMVQACCTLVTSAHIARPCAVTLPVPLTSCL